VVPEGRFRRQKITGAANGFQGGHNCLSLNRQADAQTLLNKSPILFHASFLIASRLELALAVEFDYPATNANQVATYLFACSSYTGARC
jgi:catechol-2,3-dioxygenase